MTTLQNTVTASLSRQQLLGKIAAAVDDAVEEGFEDRIPRVVQQDLSGAGAVTLTEYYTAWTTTSVDAGTLADGTTAGQLKKVQLIVDGGDGTLTFNTDDTVVFADAGDYAVLLWDGDDWIPIELGNDADGATAPAYATS